MPTVIVEHGLHVKEISCDGAVLELLNLVIDELPEVLEVEERCQKLLHLRSRREEPAASTTTHRPIPHVPIHVCTTNNKFIMHLFSVCVHKQQMSRVRHSISYILYVHTVYLIYVVCWTYTSSSNTTSLSPCTKIYVHHNVCTRHRHETVHRCRTRNFFTLPKVLFLTYTIGVRIHYNNQLL